MILVMKLKSGAIHNLDIDELISVDGRPFSPDTSDEQGDRLAILEGRIEGLENIISQLIVKGE